MANNWYKNVIFGNIKSVNLDINKTNIIDLKFADQFVKIRSVNQSFILANPIVGNFRLILTAVHYKGNND